FEWKSIRSKRLTFCRNLRKFKFTLMTSWLRANRKSQTPLKYPWRQISYRVGNTCSRPIGCLPLALSVLRPSGSESTDPKKEVENENAQTFFLNVSHLRNSVLRQRECDQCMWNLHNQPTLDTIRQSL